MPTTITEAMIRQHAFGETFARGLDYQRQGAVLALTRRDDVLLAEVEGSLPTPYRVRVTFDGAGITAVDCDCPVGGWCKHTVAALLAAVAEPGKVAERPSLATLLADLDREQLQDLLLGFADRDPRLADALDAQISILNAATRGAAPSPAPERGPRRVPLDLDAIRRQVRGALHSLDRMRSSDAYYAVGGVVGEVRAILGQAWAFIRADDGDTALDILDAITEEYVADWSHLDGSNGDTSDFFGELGAAWVEALLSVDLNAQERRGWAKKLGAWEREIADYGIEDAFEAAKVAAEYGWEEPDELAFAEQDEDDPDSWEESEEWYEDPYDPRADLIGAKLNILERRGRTEEFLELARSAREIARYATMLVSLGRAGEAVEYGLRELADPPDALTLATALRERGEPDAALQIAMHGLRLEGHKSGLAVWARDFAAALDRPEEAIRAAVIAFQSDLSLASYLRAAELSGDGWPARREELLAWLRQNQGYHLQGKIDVFLHEDLLDDAIAAVDAHPYHGYVEPVVDAVMEERPEWVIGACRRQAEPIMDGGKSDRYADAARWLGKARRAYALAGREGEWHPYKAELLAKHGRKYKLVPLIKAIG